MGSGSQLALGAHQVFSSILLQGFPAWVDSAERRSWSCPAGAPALNTQHQILSPTHPISPLSLPCQSTEITWNDNSGSAAATGVWADGAARHGQALLPAWHQHYAEPGLAGIHSNHLIFEEIKWSLTWEDANFPPLIWLVYPPPQAENLWRTDA